MPSSIADVDLDVQAKSARVTDDVITVELEDGRTISVPTAWYPRLKHATRAERGNYEIDSYGISWPDVEADFSILGLLLGRKSGELLECLKLWLDNRNRGRRVTVEQWLNLRRRDKKWKR